MIRLLFLLSLLSFSKIYEANACSCAAFPLGNKFCGSEFVAKIKVTNAPDYDPNALREYQIDVLEIYKATDEAKTALQRKLLESGPASCGLSFHQGQVAVVGGRLSNGKLHTDICDLNIMNPQQIEAQEANLRENFAKSCA